jgi:hypothetical protein
MAVNNESLGIALYQRIQRGITFACGKIKSKGFSPGYEEEFERKMYRIFVTEYHLREEREYWDGYEVKGQSLTRAAVDSLVGTIESRIYQELDNYLASFEKLDKMKAKALASKNVPTRSKAREMYANYVNFYDEKRGEYMKVRGSYYGADKWALAQTSKEIWKRERIRIKDRNLKEAFTRIVDRRPLRKGFLPKH